MIDEKKRQDRIDRKERVRKRMRVEIDPEKYIYYPAKKPIDYYDNDIPQRVAIYVRVSTDDVRQTTSYELQKIYLRCSNSLNNSQQVQFSHSVVSDSL